MKLQGDQVSVVESYCLNPKCPNPSDRLNADAIICRNCGSKLLLQDRYRLIRPLKKGGFGQIFEVDDLGTLKVIKVLNLARFTDTRSKQKAVSLFEQEAAVLSQHSHSGIPKVEPDGYFHFWPKNSQEPLLCLVMEKIDGSNLEEWLENRHNQPITPEQALDWLKQLAEILAQVHEQGYLHRDIKPSNIMLRPNGQLALIDFGAVREFTETYLTGTFIASIGYTPPEQLKGRAVPQSDFFALGRTFVHLLTGKHPIELPEDPQTEDKLIWRDNTRHISKLGVDFIYKLTGRSLADFIDELMEPSWRKRPKNTQCILKRLKKIRRPPLLELAVGAALLLVLGATGFYWYLTGVNGCSRIWLRSFPIGDHLSCGEEILTPASTIPEKQEGIEAYAAGDYDKAVDLLILAREKEPSDPEVLIYLNNARISAQKVKAFTIAVAVPISSNPDKALEILRGVAQVQNEVNQGKKINGTALKVLIADDANNPTQTRQIADALADQSNILAVVGHYASEITLAARDIYEQRQLVSISPGSTSANLPRPGDKFFFRTVPTVRVYAQKLASYLIDQARHKKVAIFYNPRSDFSKSFYDQFMASFPGSERQVVEVEAFDLSDPFFKARAAIDEAQNKGATAVVIIPDGGTSRYSLMNTTKLIKANQGRLWIAGPDTLYSPETLLVGQDAVDRLVVTVPWIAMESPNPDFTEAAQTLWGGKVSSRTSLSYDAARVLIKALETTTSPNRLDVQHALSTPAFEVKGATGEISFLPNGDRRQTRVELAKVVPSKCSDYGYTFVPEDYLEEANCANLSMD